MSAYGLFLLALVSPPLTAHKGDLPIGLPNNSNLCYINALLQAMSSSRILVKSLRHSAAIKRGRLLCSLVVVLEGLGCSFNYLKRHNLIEVILTAHRTLIDELSLTGGWAVNDQQFGSLMVEKSRRVHTKKMSSKDKAEYRCTLETMLSDEFCAAERLSGIHCPQCHMEALRIPEAMVNDPSPPVSDRSSIRHFAESLCRNTCCARRWIALPPAATATKSPLVIYIQRAVWVPLKRIAPSADEYVTSFTAGGMMSKYTEHVTFPANLDLAPYLASGCTFTALVRRHNVKCSGEENKKNRSLRYVLRSVIVHHGNTLYTGHYVAYRCWIGGGVESASANEWILGSDRYVDRVPFSSVQDCQPLEGDIPDATHSLTSTESKIDGEVMNEGEEEDGIPEEGTNLEEVASPARRIRALMAMVCGEGEIV
ncbi:ubiquitin hydrolase [Echinococcus granulosus]|uniref:ubiquitinyl hydrolase 1 n=1 Tax=Echinococcus granulosus TaxID=6210 RepID=W6U4U2_ECHGR|nr:ubiquitin hydrolase [Echinococcus granulosus]EUB56168.1 ubiquitin hydrolase [Echinococcus granulosus]